MCGSFFVPRGLSEFVPKGLKDSAWGFNLVLTPGTHLPPLQHRQPRGRGVQFPQGIR
jgi:hypothetical protein